MHGEEERLGARVVETGTPEILCTVEDRVARVCLNRPDARNALTLDMKRALVELIPQLGEDREGWMAASPIHLIHEDVPPFFVVHGATDTLVHPSVSRRLTEALQEAGMLALCESLGAAPVEKPPGSSNL